ncbi:unnamed protein product [Brassica rapa subsp. trilocularis]
MISCSLLLKNHVHYHDPKIDGEQKYMTNHLYFVWPLSEYTIKPDLLSLARAPSSAHMPMEPFL